MKNIYKTITASLLLSCGATTLMAQSGLVNETLVPVVKSVGLNIAGGIAIAGGLKALNKAFTYPHIDTKLRNTALAGTAWLVGLVAMTYFTENLIDPMEQSIAKRVFIHMVGHICYLAGSWQGLKLVKSAE